MPRYPPLFKTGQNFISFAVFLAAIILMNVLWLNANLAQANNENPGDYDRIEYGYGTIKAVGDKFTFKFNPQGGIQLHL